MSTNRIWLPETAIDAIYYEAYDSTLEDLEWDAERADEGRRRALNLAHGIRNLDSDLQRDDDLNAADVAYEADREAAEQAAQAAGNEAIARAQVAA